MKWHWLLQALVSSIQTSSMWLEFWKHTILVSNYDGNWPGQLSNQLLFHHNHTNFLHRNAVCSQDSHLESPQSIHPHVLSVWKGGLYGNKMDSSSRVLNDSCSLCVSIFTCLLFLFLHQTTSLVYMKNNITSFKRLNMTYEVMVTIEPILMDRLERMARAADDYEMEGRFVWKGGSPSPSPFPSSKEGPCCLIVLVVITREMFFSCSLSCPLVIFLLSRLTFCLSFCRRRRWTRHLLFYYSSSGHSTQTRYYKRRMDFLHQWTWL